VRNPTAPRRLGRRRGGNAGTGNSYAPGDCPRGRRAGDAGMLTTAVPTRALIALSEACCIPSYDRRQAPRLRGHRQPCGQACGQPGLPPGHRSGRRWRSGSGSLVGDIPAACCPVVMVAQADQSPTPPWAPVTRPSSSPVSSRTTRETTPSVRSTLGMVPLGRWPLACPPTLARNRRAPRTGGLSCPCGENGGARSSGDSGSDHEATVPLHASVPPGKMTDRACPRRAGALRVGGVTRARVPARVDGVILHWHIRTWTRYATIRASTFLRLGPDAGDGDGFKVSVHSGRSGAVPLAS